MERKHHRACGSSVTDSSFPLLAALLVINDLMTDPFRLRTFIIGFSLGVLFVCFLNIQPFWFMLTWAYPHFTFPDASNLQTIIYSEEVSKIAEPFHLFRFHQSPQASMKTSPSLGNFAKAAYRPAAIPVLLEFCKPMGLRNFVHNYAGVALGPGFPYPCIVGKSQSHGLHVEEERFCLVRQSRGLVFFCPAPASHPLFFPISFVDGSLPNFF